MNVLLADDHPMTIEGYHDALQKEPFAIYEPRFTKTYSFEEAWQAMERQTYELAIIDNSMPPFLDASITSGIELAQYIRTKMPSCKVIIITAHTEVVIVYDIAKRARPDGLIIKNDVTPDKLQAAVMEVIKGGSYQSPLVKNCISEIWKKELMVEDYNRQILFYLSKGFKIKDLEQTVYLTTSAIQKRISRMKKAFDVSDDTSLVKEAIKQGFI